MVKSSKLRFKPHVNALWFAHKSKGEFFFFLDHQALLGALNAKQLLEMTVLFGQDSLPSLSMLC